MFVILSTQSIMANCVTYNLVFSEISHTGIEQTFLDCTGFYSCQLLMMLKCILFVYINFHVQYKFGCGR